MSYNGGVRMNETKLRLRGVVERVNLNMQTQRVTVQAVVCCLFYHCPTGAMGWGLSEGQWPQLAMEGPVMNVQRQSRTLQQ